jgi:hypothetical protein
MGELMGEGVKIECLKLRLEESRDKANLIERGRVL